MGKNVNSELHGLERGGQQKTARRAVGINRITRDALLLVIAFIPIWSCAAPIQTGTSGSEASSGGPQAAISAGSAQGVPLTTEVDWGKYESLSVAPVVLALDEKRHRRYYSMRARRWVDNRLSEDEREVLREQLQRALSGTLGGSYPGGSVGQVDVREVSGGSVERPADRGRLVLVPKLVAAKWSRPPASILQQPLAPAPSSVAAGGAEVHFEIRQGHAGGELLGVVKERWDANLADGRIRTGMWNDAFLAFHIVSERLISRLEALGVDLKA